MKTLEEPIQTQREPAFQQEHLDAALANAALEGLRPEPPDLADLQSMVAGEITLEECIQRAKKRYGYGL